MNQPELMSRFERKRQRGERRRALLGAFAAMLLCLGLVAAAPAAAAPFEQVGIFAGSTEAPKEPGVFGEDVQLGGVGGMAVNHTGAGGVPAGTVYAASYLGNALWIAMYEPTPNGGLKFSVAWQVHPVAGPYERCGPLVATECKSRPASSPGWVDVDVDQATGYVYAFNAELLLPGSKMVVEYGADGGKELTRFGELAALSDRVAESPEELHRSEYPGGIAVDDNGRVYVFDEVRLNEPYYRLAVFEPQSPGDYEHYEYAGEVTAGLHGEGKLPTGPVLDSEGNVYVGGGQESNYIEEYEEEAPAAYHTHHSTPICSFEYAKGGITAVTVDPETGEVFFFSNKAPRRIHRLGPCDAQTGKFGPEVQEIAWSPEREDIWGLAFDPARKLSPGREAGVLYAGSPGPPGSQKGQSSLGYIFAPAEENPPTVEAESASHVTATSALLHATINPKGFATHYAFQYLSEAEYEANEPDERQAVTVSAAGGLFRLGFGGHSSGGEAKANLTAGSRTVSSLLVAEGTATTSAGSNVLTATTTSFGGFEVGQALSGAGIPGGATIVAIEAGKIRLSAPPPASASGVAISSAGPEPLAVGEALEGPGIAAGTKISALEAGKATLSQAATASGSGVAIEAGLAFDASAGQVRRALEGLGSIGARNVEVGGGPGDAAGSSPYLITFSGELGNRDLPEMSADGSQLTGGGASATVGGLHDGGGGFAGAAEAPPGGATLEGVGARGVAANLGGLKPDTAFRYRAVAESKCAPSEPGKACEAAGAPHGIHTFPAEVRALPDGRAYELVSPAQKHSGQVLAADPPISSCGGFIECKPGSLLTHFPMQAAPGGDAIAYEGTPFAESGGAPIENEYIARRDPKAGWQSANPTPSLLQSGSGQGYAGISSDLANGVLEQLSSALSPAAPAGYANLYTQSIAEPLSLTPLVSEAPPNRPPTGSGQFQVRYAGASADGERIFFEANDALTDEVPGIAPQAEDGGATKFNLYEWHEGQLALVNVVPGNTETKAGASFGAGSAHAISEKGDRAFFSDEAGQVYARIDAKETQKIEDPGKFLSASADGGKVLLSDGCLYDLKEGEEGCEDLTQGKGGFEGLLGQSEDLSHSYFVDTAVLSGEEENQAGEVAGEGEHNLYVWDEGATRFIATLAAKDNSGGSGGGVGGGIADWAPLPSNRTAQASPDGRFVTFLSQAPLTGYSNTGPCEENGGAVYQTPCPEAFVYDSASGRLTCASCNPSGATPLGWAVLRRIKGGLRLPQPRYLANSGRLFFDSQDSLSLADTNEGVEDVYEWEPQGTGDCKRAAGCVSLISAGTESIDSNLLAADESGKNAFFTTRDRLVLKDKDELFDLYDAREGGGIPSETETTRSECQGEACQPAAIPPNDPTPGSSSFQGKGNVEEKKAKKHKKKRKHAKKHKSKQSKRAQAKADHKRGGVK